MGNLTDSQIRNWKKSDERFDMRGDKVKPLLGDMENFTIHDLRRTARTHLAALGVDPHIAERCLNHKIEGVEGIYNRHDYFPERRGALVKWAGFLEACEAGEDWNVIPVRGKKKTA
jgi:integrase